MTHLLTAEARAVPLLKAALAERFAVSQSMTSGAVIHARHCALDLRRFVAGA